MTPARPPSAHEDTYATRLARLKRSRRQVAAVGAGLTAFVVGVAAGAVANGIYHEVPGWVRAVIITLVLAAGAGLALAWVRFVEEAERIEEAIEDRENLAAARIDGHPPRDGDAFWVAGLVCTVLAALAFLIAAWWAAF